MLNKLTKAQEFKFQEYVDKWLQIGLSTKRSNRTLAEQYIKDVYKAEGLKAPKHVYWAESPIGCLIMQQYLVEIYKILEKDKVLKKVNWSQVRSQVRSQVWSQVESQVRSQVGNFGFGSLDANWLAFYDYFCNETNIKNLEKIKPLCNLATECGWWLPYKDVVILSEKPTKIVMENGLLHNSQRPSIEYSDGFCIYSINGKVATEQQIERIKFNKTYDDKFEDVILKG